MTRMSPLFLLRHPARREQNKKSSTCWLLQCFFSLFPPSQLCHLCQTWEWCDQRHLVQVLDWCVGGGALGINKARCQSSIHLCQRRTINKIAFSPTYCWSAGDADRGTQRAWCTDTRWRSAAAGGSHPIIGSQGIKSAPCCLFIIACWWWINATPLPLYNSVIFPLLHKRSPIAAPVIK